MSSPDFIKRLVKLTADNGPTVLSALGVAGTVTTALLTGKATFKAAEIIQTETDKRIKQQELSELPVTEEFRLPITRKDKIKLVWVQYLPPAGVALGTITCIVFANHINAKRLAALSTAYMLSDKAYNEYKDKVTEKLGLTKEKNMRDEIAQEQVRRNPAGNQVIIGGENALCYEAYTGRYFRCDVETIRKAVNDINQEIIHNDYATLAEFYDKVGLEVTPVSTEVGWNTDHILEMDFSTVLADNNQPCLVLTYSVWPTKASPFRSR